MSVQYSVTLNKSLLFYSKTSTRADWWRIRLFNEIIFFRISYNLYPPLHLSIQPMPRFRKIETFQFLRIPTDFDKKKLKSHGVLSTDFNMDIIPIQFTTHTLTDSTKIQKFQRIFKFDIQLGDAYMLIKRIKPIILKRINWLKSQPTTVIFCNNISIISTSFTAVSRNIIFSMVQREIIYSVASLFMPRLSQRGISSTFVVKIFTR